MNKLNFLKWVSHLQELTPEQIKEVQNRIKLLGHAVESVTLEDSNDWLWTGIWNALKSEGLVTASALLGGQKSNARKAYKRVAEEVQKDLTKLFKRQLGSISSTEQVTIGLIVGQCLIKWCMKRKIPPTLGSVLLNTHHSIESIEESFPGYIASGYLPILIKKDAINVSSSIRRRERRSEASGLTSG